MSQKTTKRICPKCQFEDITGLQKCPRDGMVLTARVKDPLIGQVIAEKYEIVSMLGKGGMSVVYQARHTMMNRLVAVKMLRPELVAVPQLLQRFKQESNAVAALRHPNIVTVFDFGLLPNGTPYLIMDYLEGETLNETIKREKFLTAERAIPLFAQACDALGHAHDHGVIHRDIKPANLLIRKDKTSGEESLTIFDFGIAKILGQDGSTIHKLTTSGEVFGSPLYMSPEQCGGEHVTKSTDIYSLACVFYECLAGTPPLVGTSPMETLMRHCNDEPLSIMETNPNQTIPQGLEDAIMMALNKAPEDRQADMRQFRDQILESAHLRMMSSSLHLTQERKHLEGIIEQSDQSLPAVSGTMPAVGEESFASGSQKARGESFISGSQPQAGAKGRDTGVQKKTDGGKSGKDTKRHTKSTTSIKKGVKVPAPLIIALTVLIATAGIMVVLNTFVFGNNNVIVVPDSGDEDDTSTGDGSTSEDGSTSGKAKDGSGGEAGKDNTGTTGSEGTAGGSDTTSGSSTSGSSSIESNTTSGGETTGSSSGTSGTNTAGDGKTTGTTGSGSTTGTASGGSTTGTTASSTTSSTGKSGGKTEGKTGDTSVASAVPFDGVITTKPFSAPERMKLTNLDKVFSARIEFDGRLNTAMPSSLLPKSVDETSGGKRSVVKVIIAPTDLQPANISCAQAADALFKKLFSNSMCHPEAQQVKESYGAAAKTNEVYVQRINFSQDDRKSCEYIVYLKHNGRLVACQFMPSKISEKEIEKTIVDFVPNLENIIKAGSAQ